MENLAYAPVEVLNWDDPYGIIRQAEQEKALQGLVDKILSNPEEMDEVFRTTDDLQGLLKCWRMKYIQIILFLMMLK